MIHEQKHYLLALLKKIFAFLKQIEPIKDSYDVAWWGPYFIPKPHQWYPSHFLFYDGHLYCSLIIEGDSYDLSWELGTSDIKFEQGWGSLGDFYNDERLWSRALSQIYKRLKKAIENPENYNRRVARLLHLHCRIGKIKRRYTWDKNVKSLLPLSKISQLERILAQAKRLPKLRKMTLSMYLNVVAAAYDAVLKELHPLSPLEKYQRRADGRHGGLLDLPPQDPKAFEKWYHSGQWSGSHPWEIVFGHPHGIMIAPHHDREKGWNYSLWVDSLGWYKTAALMALALGKKKVPFEFHRSKEVLDALKGEDDVEVSPSFDIDAVQFDELKESRPDAIHHICWNTTPQILPVTPEQKKRIVQAKREGRSTK